MRLCKTRSCYSNESLILLKILAISLNRLKCIPFLNYLTFFLSLFRLNDNTHLIAITFRGFISPDSGPSAHLKAIPVYTLTQDVRLIVGHIFVQGGPPISPVDLSFPHTEPTPTFFFFHGESFPNCCFSSIIFCENVFRGLFAHLMLRFYTETVS